MLQNGGVAKCPVFVELHERKLVAEIVNKETGEKEKRVFKRPTVTVVIMAPFGPLMFNSTMTKGRFGMFIDSRKAATARRSTHETWSDLFHTLCRFTGFFEAAAALAKAQSLTGRSVV